MRTSIHRKLKKRKLYIEMQKKYRTKISKIDNPNIVLENQIK
jgi:hypothetical protein